MGCRTDGPSGRSVPLKPATFGAMGTGAHRPAGRFAASYGCDRSTPLVPWHLLRGYGEHGDEYWKARYDTVFDRAEALGLRFVGPEYPNGRRADPWPDELPRNSLCVPTLHHAQQKPATATRQLDFVFASTSISDRVEVHALNAVEDWGPAITVES